MGYINYFSGILQLLENPREIFLLENNVVVNFAAELPQSRGSTIIQVYIWGNFADNILKSYKKDDYILVEGYLSLRIIENPDLVKKDFHKVTLSVLKLYPFLFQSDKNPFKY